MAAYNSFSASIFLLRVKLEIVTISMGTLKKSSLSFFLRWVFVNLLRQPFGSFADFVINSRLLFNCTSKTSRGNSNQSPSAIKIDDQRSTTVTKTSILFTSFVSSTKHFIMELNLQYQGLESVWSKKSRGIDEISSINSIQITDLDGFVPMPRSTPVIFNNWHKDFVKYVGTGFAKRVISLAPSSYYPNFAHQIHIMGRQTNGQDIVLVLNWSIQLEHSDIKSVRLGQHVPKVWM